MDRVQLKQTIYKELISCKKIKSIITYGNLSKNVGINLDDNNEQTLLSDILGELSKEEYKNGRPLISALVINRDKGKPGSGFFTMAKDIGVLTDKDDPDSFWFNQIQQLFK